MERTCICGLVFVLHWLLLTTVTFAQGLPQRHQPIEQYLDAKTNMIAWIDTKGISQKDLRDLFQSMTGQPSDSEVDGFFNMLKTLEIDRLVVISEGGLLGTWDNFVFVVFSRKPEETLPTIRELLPPETQSKLEKDRILLSASEVSINQILSKDGALDPSLRSRLETSDAPNGCICRLREDSLEVDLIRSLIRTPPNSPMNSVLDALANQSTILVQGTIPIPVKLDMEASDVQNAQNLAASLRNLLQADEGEQSSIEIAVKGNITSVSISRIPDWKTIRDKVLGPGIREAQSLNNIRQIMLAMHNYESVHGTLPPQSLTDKEGKKLLSWRVLLLPYLEEQALYEQFHLDEPWDSPHNKTLIEKMPEVFKTPLEHGDAVLGKTRYVAPLTATSIFGRPGKPMRLSEIKDGISLTIALMEVGSTRSVVWTSPDDVVIGPNDTLTNFADSGEESVIVAAADGAAHKMRASLSKETFHALIGATDGVLVQDHEWRQ